MAHNPASRILRNVRAGLSQLMNRRIADYNYTFTSSANNNNLYTVLTGDGWDGTTPKNFNITINASVLLGSTSTSSPGLLIPLASFPARSTITIDNNGTIGGKGGAGGSASSGGSGGTGLSVTGSGIPVTFDNTGSEIYGGGGGGGGGGYRSNAPTGCSGGKSPVCQFGLTCTGGGGGAGYGNGSAGGGSGGSSRSNLCGACAGGCSCTGGSGGSGGGKGSSGSTGGNGSGCTDSSGPWSGGSGGYSVNGYSKITWTATGTLTGSTTG